MPFPDRGSRTLVLALVLLGGGPLAGGEDVERGTFPIPGHGALRLQVPPGWGVRASSEPANASLQLRLAPPAGDSFSLQLTAVWLTPEKLSALTPEKVKAATYQAASLPLQHSEERIATVEELRGVETAGYTISLTDRTPAVGDSKYLTQGVLVTGDLMVVFTFLYREVPCAERDQALQMLAGGRYVRGPR